ncbi:MAG: RNA polymerase sigma factor [Anaerolineales bacterium]|jgi:RNA polymerase sigma-70 factor (ECF subfamily)
MGESDIGAVEDSKLIARAKRGDAHAYGVLYRRYAEAIYKYIRLRVSDEHTAQDLTEVVFLRSYESLSRYRERGLRFSAYLYQVARNLLVDHYRQANEMLSIDEIEPASGERLSMDERFIQHEQVEMIKQAMDRLPEEYQEIIRLRVILDVPTQEAAQWMKKSEGAVRVLLHRALKALRREVGMIHEG